MAFGLLNMHPWVFLRYTVREFEEKVAGAYARYEHAFDLVMRHALVTGQWSRRVTFKDLTGKETPAPLDPRQRVEEEQTEDDLDRIERAKVLLAEAQMRMASGDGRPQIEE